MNTPVLETERLLLRPFRQEDTEAVFEGWESDPEVSRYMLWTCHNDIEKTREWITFELGHIEKQDWYRFAVTLKDTERLIGTGLIYYEYEVEGWEVAYNLSRQYWGHGYATEAMERIIEFAHDSLGITEVVGRYAAENSASSNVLNKLGFKYEREIPYVCNDGLVRMKGIQCRLVIK